MAPSGTHPAAPDPGASPRRRHPRWPYWLAGCLILLPVVLVVVLLAWTSSSASLRQALALAQRFLPEGQSLQFTDATGSITRGGRIAQLTWSGPGTTVVVEGFELDWALRGLLDEDLQVRTLRAERIHVRLEPRAEAPPGDPFVMPQQVTLPFHVTLPLQVGRVEIQMVDPDGTSTVHVIEDVGALYRYDGELHVLRLDSLAYGQSRLQAVAQLHARDLALQARLAAFLRDLSPQMPLAMLLHADASGSLAGGDEASLALDVDAREQPRGAPDPDAARLLEELASLRTTLEEPDAADPRIAQMFLRATMHPWRAQPVQSMQLRASRLNAGAFHASAPVTLLEGEADVTPVAGGEGSWDLVLALRNGEPGAWDTQHLPVRTVDARARLAPQDVVIETARITLSGEPAGTVELEGHVPRAGLAGAQLQLQLREVDLRQVMGSLPETRFAGALDLSPLPQQDDAGAATGWRAQVQVTNASAGRLDDERLPLQSMAGTLRVTPERWQSDDLELTVGGGSLRVGGHYMPASQVLDVRGTLRSLPLAAIHGELAAGGASALSGSMAITGDIDEQVAFDADITSDAAAGTLDEWEIRKVRVEGDWSPTRLRIANIDVDALRARIQGDGIDLSLPDLERIEARATASAPGLAFQADAQMSDREGGGTLSLQLESAAETMAWLRSLPLVGEQLPAMQASGAATLQAQWQGGWRQWMDGLANPGRYPQLSVDARLSSDALRAELPEGSAVALLDVSALEASLQGNLANAALALGGSIRADEQAATLDVRVGMQRDAQDAPIPGWQFLFERMVVDATLAGQEEPWHLALADGLQVNLSTSPGLELQTTAGELSLAPPPMPGVDTRALQIGWDPLQLRRTAQGAVRLQSRGTIQGIQPGWLDLLRDEFGDGRLQAAGFGTDLLLSAEWDLALDENLAVNARLQREQGDLWLLGAAISDPQSTAPRRPEGGIAAGIRAIEFSIASRAQELALELNWDSERAGIIHANASTRLVQSADGWRLDPGAPVEGRIETRLQDLAMWAVFAPPGWRIQGELDADLALSGTVGTPLLRGAISGRQINVRSVLDGVELHDGVLRAALDGQQLAIEELVFQGGTGSRAYIPGISGNRTPAPSARGSMTARGVIDWRGVESAPPGETGIAMDMRATLERMQVLVRNDRQLTVSGDLSASLDEGTLRVRGDLNVDRATILLPDAGAPTLGDDVIVVRNDDPLELIEVGVEAGESGQLESARPMDVEITLDLGRDLALQGYGITTRLEGELVVRSSPLASQPFSLFGEVRTDEGRYRAWGQALNVETGEVAFNGSYENPSLNLLAIRPEIEVRAGVRVTGTLQAPQVALYSDPPLPEAEKLSWVVLGRPTAIGGGEGTSVQRAALGLLAGRAVGSLADNLGVDELGLGDSGVSVGKRISDQLYLTYEAGLSGAASTLYIFYDITRRFTVRAESGEANAVDLIYSFDFD